MAAQHTERFTDEQLSSFRSRMHWVADASVLARYNKDWRRSHWEREMVNELTRAIEALGFTLSEKNAASKPEAREQAGGEAVASPIPANMDAAS